MCIGVMGVKANSHVMRSQGKTQKIRTRKKGNHHDNTANTFLRRQARRIESRHSSGYGSSPTARFVKFNRVFYARRNVFVLFGEDKTRRLGFKFRIPRDQNPEAPCPMQVMWPHNRMRKNRRLGNKSPEDRKMSTFRVLPCGQIPPRLPF